MKLVAAWLTMLVLAIAAATSCSINHKSNEYECVLPSDCDPFPGRQCVGGFCVTSGGPTDARPDMGPVIDGPRDASPDSVMCPAQCTSCREPGHECVIDCATTSCNSEVVCPVGWNCTIGCTTTNSCTQGIDCGNAKSCTVICSGTSSCRDLVCGDGKCNVTCSGKSSCRDMDCSDSCACDITCATGANAASCEGNSCPLGCFGAGFGRCSSQAPGCNTCM